MSKNERFVLVREDVLTEAMKKTLDAKELLERGKAENIAAAATMVDLSRSAFYKYRDAVFPFHHLVKERIITLSLHLEDRSGVLSAVLEVVASVGCNILTIHQTIPLQGKANVTLSIDGSSMNMGMEELLQQLKKLEFVLKVEILGSGA